MPVSIALATDYLVETSESAFWMLSAVIAEVPFRVFAFPVRESSTTTEGVPVTLIS